MENKYIELIEKVRERIKNKEIDDIMNALSWISLLQLANVTDRGRFYNDYLFMLVDYDSAVTEMLYNHGLFPGMIYQGPEKIEDFKKYGSIYVVCYEYPNYIGIPKFAIQVPYFKFSDLTPNETLRTFDKLMQLNNQYEKDLFGNGFDIV